MLSCRAIVLAAVIVGCAIVSQKNCPESTGDDAAVPEGQGGRGGRFGNRPEGGNDKWAGKGAEAGAAWKAKFAAYKPCAEACGLGDKGSEKGSFNPNCHRDETFRTCAKACKEADNTDRKACKQLACECINQQIESGVCVAEPKDCAAEADQSGESREKGEKGQRGGNRGGQQRGGKPQGDDQRGGPRANGQNGNGNGQNGNGNGQNGNGGNGQNGNGGNGQNGNGNGQRGNGGNGQNGQGRGGRGGQP